MDLKTPRLPKSEFLSQFRWFVFPTILIIAFFTSSCETTGHKFQNFSPTPGKEITLNASLSKPDGDGPFPAVIILHGCAGITELHSTWASRLTEWGYVSMIVDSHGPRGISNNCGGNKKVNVTRRATDAYSAKNYLAGLPYVDRNHIGVIGFSEGAGTVLAAVEKSPINYISLMENKSPFQAAVAFYPHCSLSTDVNTNLIILIGEKDDWTSASVCEQNIPYSKNNEYEVTLKIYPNATHCFDYEKKYRVYKGHVLKYDHSATMDAVNRVKSFFHKYLKT